MIYLDDSFYIYIFYIHTRVCIYFLDCGTVSDFYVFFQYFFLSAFATTYYRCGYAVEICWQGNCTFCLRFVVFLAQWLQVFFGWRLAEDILYEIGFQVIFLINANPLKALRNGRVLQCFLKLGDPEVVGRQSLSLCAAVLVVIVKDHVCKLQIAIVYFGRQFRVVCSLARNWGCCCYWYCWWWQSAKKFCSEVVTLLFDSFTVNLDSVRYLIFWSHTQVIPSHSGCLNRLKSAELLDAGNSADRISQRSWYSKNFLLALSA